MKDIACLLFLFAFLTKIARCVWPETIDGGEEFGLWLMAVAAAGVYLLDLADER